METSLVFLCGFAWLAGLLDAIVGGGGLIQLPALMVFGGTLSLPAILGVNKFASFCGTMIAAMRYVRAVRLNPTITAIAATLAFVGAVFGASLATRLSPEAFRPIILILLVVVLAYTMLHKDFGKAAGVGISESKKPAAAAGTGILIGAYDGFFGPGTGSFLIVTFIGVFGLNFLQASAHAKVVNLATNFAAVLYFWLNGHIRFDIALPMAFCNIIGARMGASLAIARGSGFVRILFLCVVSALIVRLGYDLLPRQAVNAATAEAASHLHIVSSCSTVEERAEQRCVSSP